MSPSAPSSPTWTRCWPRCRPTARTTPRPAQAPGGARLRPHRGLRRGDLGLVRRRSSARTGRARKSIAGELVQTMRYGENPHQAAAFYRFAEPAHRRRHRPPAAGQGAQLQQHQRHRRGLRADRRVRSRRERRPCAIIKHANPCGVATGRRPDGGLRAGAGLRSGQRLRRHHRAEPAGSTRRPPTEILKLFTEVVIAPEADDDAVALFAQEEERAPADHRRPARPAGAGRDLQVGGRRLPGPGPRRRPPDAGRPEGGHQARAHRRRRCATCCSPSPSPST